MGRQSSRLYFNGKDHKDIYFQGHYHKAMYYGKEGGYIWQKLPNGNEGYNIVGTRKNSYGYLANIDPIPSRSINMTMVSGGLCYVNGYNPIVGIGQGRCNGGGYEMITTDGLQWTKTNGSPYNIHYALHKALSVTNGSNYTYVYDVTYTDAYKYINSQMIYEVDWTRYRPTSTQLATKPTKIGNNIYGVCGGTRLPDVGYKNIPCFFLFSQTTYKAIDVPISSAKAILDFTPSSDDSINVNISASPCAYNHDTNLGTITVSALDSTNERRYRYGFIRFWEDSFTLIPVPYGEHLADWGISIKWNVRRSNADIVCIQEGDNLYVLRVTDNSYTIINTLSASGTITVSQLPSGLKTMAIGSLNIANHIATDGVNLIADNNGMYFDYAEGTKHYLVYFSDSYMQNPSFCFDTMDITNYQE